MGKKSSTKKNRKPQVQAQSQVNKAKLSRPGLVIPSLNGEMSVASAPVAQAPTQKVLNFGEQTEYVRSDIIRITLLLIIMGLILTGLVITNAKTSLLKTAGKELGSFLKLQ